MNFNSFRFQHAFLDVSALSDAGVSWNVIIRTAMLSVTFVKESLTLIVSSGLDAKSIDSYLGYTDIIYSTVASAVRRANHPGLNVTLVFKAYEAANFCVEFIPELVGHAYKPREDHFVIPGTMAVPLLLYVPRPIEMSKYDRVLFAGTFDHLHAGHKLVLTRAFFLASQILYVAITTDDLIRNKRYSAALEPFETRKARVCEFIEGMRPAFAGSVTVVYLATEDGVGPAGVLDFDALVVTPETASGGDMVNSARVMNSKVAVELHVIELLGNDAIDKKLSSTSVRQLICQGLPGGEPDLIALHEEWCALANDLKVNVSKSSNWWSRLRDMYGLKPWRHYHTLRHLKEFLQIAKSEFDCGVSKELLLSIWFHDAIYDPRSSSNENDSISLFEAFVDECQISNMVDCVSVKHAISLTSDHKSNLSQAGQADSEWVKYFLEMDLAILGAEKDRYQQYMAQIREEYKFLNDTEFNRGRRTFLGNYMDFKFRYLSIRKELNQRITENVTCEYELMSR